jgi:plasmid stability protein
MKYKRATVYFSPDIHKALRLRAAESGSSILQIANAALQQALLDEAADLDSLRPAKGSYHRCTWTQ